MSKTIQTPRVLKVGRRSVSAIARLSGPLRDEVNQMLLDSVPYREISAKLATSGIRITMRQLSTWRRRGHQLWLKENQRLDEMKAVREFTMKLVRECAGGSIQEAGLLIAATQMYELLSGFDPKTLKQKLNEDPEFYAKLVTALARTNESGLKYERFRTEVAETKAKLEATLAAAKAGGFTDEVIASLERDLKLL